MKNLKIFVLLTVLLFCTQKLFAQKSLKARDMVIHITAGPDYERKVLIDIYRRANVIKIVYANWDSIKRTEIRKDTAYIRLSKKFEKQKRWDDTDGQKTLDSIGVFHERYSVYDRDSIIFSAKKDTAYNNLLDRVSDLTEEELSQTKKNKNGVTTVILDGVYFKFEIANKSGNKVLYSHSPNKSRDPLLYNLIESTFNISRKQKLKVKGFLWY